MLAGQVVDDPHIGRRCGEAGVKECCIQPQPQRNQPQQPAIRHPARLRRHLRLTQVRRLDVSSSNASIVAVLLHSAEHRRAIHGMSRPGCCLRQAQSQIWRHTLTCGRRCPWQRSTPRSLAGSRAPQPGPATCSRGLRVWDGFPSILRAGSMTASVAAECLLLLSVANQPRCACSLSPQSAS